MNWNKNIYIQNGLDFRSVQNLRHFYAKLVQWYALKLSKKVLKSFSKKIKKFGLFSFKRFVYVISQISNYPRLFYGQWYQTKKYRKKSQQKQLSWKEIWLLECLHAGQWPKVGENRVNDNDTSTVIYLVIYVTSFSNISYCINCE